MESDAPLEQWRARIVHCSEPTTPQEIPVYVERVIFARKPSALRFLAHLSDCEENYERGQCGCNDYAISPLGAVANVIAARDCIAVEIAPPGGLFQHEAVAPWREALEATLVAMTSRREAEDVHEEATYGGTMSVGIYTDEHEIILKNHDRARARMEAALERLSVEKEG